MDSESSSLLNAFAFVGIWVVRGLRLLFVTPKAKRDEKTFNVIKKRRDQNFWEVE